MRFWAALSNSGRVAGFGISRSNQESISIGSVMYQRGKNVVVRAPDTPRDCSRGLSPVQADQPSGGPPPVGSRFFGPDPSAHRQLARFGSRIAPSPTVNLIANRHWRQRSDQFGCVALVAERGAAIPKVHVAIRLSRRLISRTSGHSIAR